MRSHTTKEVCAVIVSYNPESILEDNIKSLLPQVGRCLIVDNGSSVRTPLEEYQKKYGVIVHYLQKNMGIAYALNVGLQYCVKNGFALMLSMDQDTVLNKNAVYVLLECMTNSGSASVGINWDNKIKKNQYVKYLITSGNLVKTFAAQQIGGYDNKLFIDSVDFDFSLRLVDAGYKLMKVAKAKAIHNLGNRQGDSNYITHSVNRYAYIYRNHFYLCRKYIINHPLFVFKKNIILLIDLIQILLFDKDRILKIKILKESYCEYKKML